MRIESHINAMPIQVEQQNPMAFFEAFESSQQNVDLEDDPFSPIPLSESAVRKQTTVNKNAFKDFNGTVQVQLRNQPLEQQHLPTGVTMGGLRGEEQMDAPITQLTYTNRASNVSQHAVATTPNPSISRYAATLTADQWAEMDLSITGGANNVQNGAAQNADVSYNLYAGNSSSNSPFGTVQQQQAQMQSFMNNTTNNNASSVNGIQALQRQPANFQQFSQAPPTRASGETLSDAALAAFQRSIMASGSNGSQEMISVLDATLMRQVQFGNNGNPQTSMMENMPGMQLQQQQQGLNQLQESFSSSFGSSAYDSANADEEDESGDPRFKPFHEEKWAIRYRELVHYHRDNGHSAVPHTYPPNPQLARWVKRQRRQCKLLRENKPSTMTYERLELLNMLEFIWDSHEVNWREKLLALDSFRMEHGHCNVPSNYVDKKLATWVKCQRRQYKLYCDGKGSAMCTRRIQELEGRGFEWEIRSSSSKQTTLRDDDEDKDMSLMK